MNSKRIKTNIERFGACHPMKNEKIKEKRNKTCLERFGCETPFSCEEFREKAKKTSLELYGAEFYSSSEEGRQRIKESRQNETVFDGELYSKDDTERFCQTIDKKYLKSGGYRTLIKDDKRMFFSILKYSEPINQCKSVTFRARVSYLRGDITEFMCPKCGKYYKWNNTQFVFKMTRDDEHFSNNWNLEYYTKFFGEEEGEKRFEETLKKRQEGAKKTSKHKVNSKQYYITKYGEEEGLKRYIQSCENRISGQSRTFSKKSQDFFNKLVEKCRLDKDKCFYATNNGEKVFVLDDDTQKKLGQGSIRPDFVIGNRIIEYNGVYWHKNSSERDFIKKSFYESKGFQVLTIWENEDENHALKRACDFINEDRFKVLTQSGFSEFSGIRRTETNKTLKIFFGDSFIEVSEDHKFMVFGKEVIAKTLREGDVLQTRFDKNVIITKIETSESPEEKCFVYDVLETQDHSYVTNGVISHNCSFLGSSHTLVSKESLQRFKSQEPEMVLAQRLKVYKEPEPKHKYIIGVDPAKFGGDSYAIQVLDVTSFPFVQVASAKLKDENFQIMPGFIVEWGKWYNEGLLIIENNEGAGTYANVVIHNDYEYENLYFERTFGTFKHDTKTKIEPGFRTTPKSRNIIIDTLKQLIDNELLIINDLDTIKEFNTFVLKKDKYQADDGCHDDMIMSLCIALAPFGDVKNFDNITDLVKKMYSKDTTTDFTDYLCLGNFDDYSDFSVDDSRSGSFGSDFDDVLFEISKKGSY